MASNGFTIFVSRLLAVSGALLLLLQAVFLLTPLYLEITAIQGAAGSAIPGDPEQFLWRQVVGAWSAVLAWSYLRWSPVLVSRQLPALVPLFHLFAFVCSATVIVYGNGGRYLVFLFGMQQLLLLACSMLMVTVQEE